MKIVRINMPLLHYQSNLSCMKFFISFIIMSSIFVCSMAQSLSDQVEIVRDTFGVPHVFGKTDAAVAYGLAWAHSEDVTLALFN